MGERVILCGLGHVGQRIAQLLRALDVDVTVVTLASRDAWRHRAEAAGAVIIDGDARDEATLRRAGIESASALIVATQEDVVNIEVSLDALRIVPGLPVVTRLFDQRLAEQLEGSLGVRRAPAKSTLAAPTFAAAALGESVIGAFSVEGTPMVVGRVEIEGPLVAETPRALAERHGVRVLNRPHDVALVEGEVVVVVSPRAAFDEIAGPACVARVQPAGAERHLWAVARGMWLDAPRLLRVALLTLVALTALSVVVFHYGLGVSFADAFYFTITTITTTGYGDITPRGSGWVLQLYGCLVMLLGSAGMATLYSLVTDFVVAERFRRVAGGHEIPASGHVIVVGAGNLGFRVLDELRRMGRQAVAVSLSAEEDLIADIRARHAVVPGDARMDSVLTAASVSTAAAVLAVTGDDAVNLGVGLAAKKLAPRVRTVIRVFDPEFAAKVERGLGLDVALSASAIAAPTFVAAALDVGVRDAFVVDGELVALCDRDAPEEWAGRSPREIEREAGLTVVLRRPRGAAEYRVAPLEEPLTRGEHVVVVKHHPLRGSHSALVAGTSRGV